MAAVRAKYHYRSHRFPVKAEIAVAVIEDLRSKTDDGCVDPDDLVNVSKPVDAPLHECFEWNNGRAAVLYRRTQAQNIIRSIEVRVDEEASRPKYLGVVSLRDDVNRERRFFTDAETAVKEHQPQLLADAMCLLRGAQRRYEQIKKLAPVWDALDRVENDN